MSDETASPADSLTVAESTPLLDGQPAPVEQLPDVALAADAPAPDPAPAVPTLSLEPASGPDGSSTRLVASGFEPESWVSVFAGLRWLCNTRVSEHGTFGASFGVTRPAGPGEVTVVAQIYSAVHAAAQGREPSTHVVERDIDTAPMASAAFAVTEG